MGRPRVQVDALVMGGLRSGGGGVECGLTRGNNGVNLGGINELHPIRHNTAVDSPAGAVPIFIRYLVSYQI